MEIGQTKVVQVQAKTLRIHCKVCDNFTASILDENGVELGGQEDGYVPGFMPGNHYGDYLILDINIDTGMVTNWEVPTKEEIETFIAKREE